MPNHKAEKIISSIAEVTTHTDRELLEASLMSTLFELLDLRRIALYRIIFEYGEQRCLLTTDIIEGDITFHDPCDSNSLFNISQIMGLEATLEAQAPQYFDHGKNQVSSYAYPLTDRTGNISRVFFITGNDLHEKTNESLLNGYFEIYRNYVCLLDDSEHDTLTQLLNRRTFDRDLERILSSWQQPCDHMELSTKTPSQNPLRRQVTDDAKNWLAVIDIDFFKRINDNYGHLYGDEVLLLLANIMRESFRSYDKLFRFGGEEFVVILRSTNQDGAEVALERFRHNIANHRFPQIDQVTVSIGYVEITNQGIPAVVLGHADDALYYAKEHGRNRICYYSDLVEQGELKPSTPISHDSDIELF